MAECYYEPTPATDGATMNPVPGATFQVFELSDTGFTTPLSLRVGAGNPTTTVAASESLATLPGVWVTSPNFEHIWVSGTFEWRRDSIDGAKAAIQDAKVAAVDAAASSNSSAQSSADSAQAAVDAAALMDAPADEVLANLAGNPDSQFAGQLSSTYVKVTEGPLSLTDPRVGANLNGSADCNPAFATAFSLMPSGGGVLRIPPGQVALTGKVSIPSKVTVVGSGRQATTIKRQFAAGYTGILVELSGQWGGLENLTIDGLGSSTELLRASNNRLSITDVQLQNSAADGFRLFGSSSPSAHGNSITRLHVSGCPGIGIHAQSYAYDNRFQDVVVSQSGKGVVINDQHTRWINLHVWGCTDDGVEIRGKNAQFIDPFIETCGNGIDAFNASGLQVIGGRLWRNESYGASIDTAHRARFIGVDMVENQTFGLRGANSQYVQVIGCQFFDEITPTKRQDRPISMSGTSDYWTIQGNVLRAADHSVGGNTIVGANNQVNGNIE